MKNLILFSILISLPHSTKPLSKNGLRIGIGITYVALSHLCSKYEREYIEKQKEIDPGKFTAKEYEELIQTDRAKRKLYKFTKICLMGITLVYICGDMVSTLMQTIDKIYPDQGVQNALRRVREAQEVVREMRRLREAQEALNRYIRKEELLRELWRRRTKYAGMRPENAKFREG